MKEINCIICNSKSDYLDNYKFNVNSDEDHYGVLKIYYCKLCNFAFAHPMPTDEKLNYYYENIYGELGRPHEINYNLDSALYSKKNLSYIQYLTNFLNFEEIRNVFDFGSGTGDLGYLLKKKFSHLKLYTIEKDKFAKKILIKRDYKIYENFEGIDTKMDLILSVHVITLMKNLNIVRQFQEISKPNSHWFIEVPNNLFKEKFLKRPYDSPHLIFFSEKTFHKIKEFFHIDLINLAFSSHSIDKNFELMSNSKKKFENWSLKNKISILERLKRLIKSFIPNKILKYRSFILQEKENDEFYLNKKNSWCLRAIFKIK